MPRTCFRRRCWRLGGESPGSKGVHHCVPGSTASQPTRALMPGAPALGGYRPSRPHRSRLQNRHNMMRFGGCSPIQTRCWRESPTPRQDQRPATARPRRSSSHSLLACNGCHLARRQQFSCVTYLASTPKRWRQCSRPARQPSRALCSAVVRRWTVRATQLRVGRRRSRPRNAS